MEEEERPKPNYYMTYDNKNAMWVMNVTDPATKEVVEKKIFSGGMWRKLVEKKVARR